MDLTAAGPVSSAVRSLCADFNGFGLDLHRGLPSGGNTFISPLGIGAALAALLQGARGQTATELARVLRLEGTAEDTARAMAELRGNPHAAQDPWRKPGTMRPRSSRPPCGKPSGSP